MSDMTKTLKAGEYRVTHSVGANQSGIRLDRFLMNRYRHRSREQLKKAIEGGGVSVERKGAKHLEMGKMKASFSLQGGDIVHLLSRRQKEPEVNFRYHTLFEDESILVIAKPANLPVHPAGRYFFNTLLTHLKTNGFDENLKNERDFYLVHRIDKETSGVLLIGKTKEACNLLTAQFRNRETSKYYLAIVRGRPLEKKFKIETPIGKIPGSKIGLRMYPLAIEKGGLEASTEFEVIETRESEQGVFSLLACFPRTGRQHQIRIHAEIAGYPLVGDKIYGLSDDEVLALLDAHREEMLDEESASEDLSTDPEEDFNPFGNEDPEEPFPKKNTALLAEAVLKKLILPRHALHAAGLRFVHPVSQKTISFEAPLPDDLRGFFLSLTGTDVSTFRTEHW